MTDQQKKREHVGRLLKAEITIRATPRQVWDAWAKADGISKWFVDSCEGDMEPGATVTWIFDAFGYRLPIEVFEATPGERIAIGGDIPGRPPVLQEVFVRQDGGMTQLRLASSGFGDGEQWDEEYEGQKSGWAMALATLKFWLENHAGDERAHAIVMQPVEAGYDVIVPLLTTCEGVSSWLCEVDGEGRLEVGRKLDLNGCEGEVLTMTGRETLIGWKDKGAVIGLKVFQIPTSTMIAIDYNAWGRSREVPPETKAWLDATIERLAEGVASA